MKVEQLMRRHVYTCLPGDSVNAAARIMWEHDCGCVPVVVPDAGGVRVVGMLTDRDVCMAAYTQGRPLTAIPVDSAMSKEVRSCRTSDNLSVACKVLRTNQVRRLPVLDANEHLVGMLSLTDVAKEGAHEQARTGRREVTAQMVGDTMEAICQPRSPQELVAA